MSDMNPYLNHATPPDDWQPASDEVVRLTRRMRGRKSRRRFLQTSGSIVGGLLAVTSGWFVGRVFTREDEYNFGGISCADAMARANAMMQGYQLPDVEVTQLKEHVQLCPKCKPWFEKMNGMEMFTQMIPLCRNNGEA